MWVGVKLVLGVLEKVCCEEGVVMVVVVAVVVRCTVGGRCRRGLASGGSAGRAQVLLHCGTGHVARSVSSCVCSHW